MAEYEAGEVEFGVDVETGADYEFGGGAADYAAGADAVDAALGAVRRRALKGYVPAGAKKVRGMFTYLVGIPTNAALYAGGALGTAVTTCNTPYQIIDIVMLESTAGVFNITSLLLGDTNMMLSGGAIAATYFGAAQQNRFVRFTTLQRGQTTLITFVAGGGLTTLTYTLGVTLKVRSYRRS